MLSNLPPDSKIGFGNIAKPDLRPGGLLTLLSEVREQLALINRDTNFIESAVEFGVTVQTLFSLDNRKPISYFAVFALLSVVCNC